MAWTSMKAWSGSEVLTSADQNTYVGSNIQYVYDNKPEANQWIGGTVNVAQENQRIESGTAEVTFTTAQSGVVEVTFNTAFGSAPRVTGAAAHTGTVAYNTLNFAANTVGTGGFNASLYKVTTGTITGSRPFTWIAIGA